MKKLIWLFFTILNIACNAQDIKVYKIECKTVLENNYSNLKIDVYSIDDYAAHVDYEGYNILEDTIFVKICYGPSLWQHEGQPYISHFLVENIQKPVYYIRAVASISTMEEECFPVYESDTMWDTAIVADLTGIRNPVNISRFEVFPNPSSSGQELRFYAARPEQLNIELLDFTGRVVRSVWNGNIPAGQNMITADLRDLNRGIYFYRLHTTEGNSFIKAVLN